MTERFPKASVPLLIYDGDCSFCRLWIGRWQRITGDRVAYAPYQEVADRFPELPRERFRESVHLLEPNGRWFRGAEAVFRSLATTPGQGAWLWLYRHVPGFAALSEWAYRLVARNRPALMRLNRLNRGGRPMARRQRYVSDTLTHFVGGGLPEAEQYTVLVKVLRTGWLTHKPHLDQPSLGTTARVEQEFSGNRMINPQMICFCDIPESELAIHTGKYSRFGIAFSREFLVRNGANPVFYVAAGSSVLRLRPGQKRPSFEKTTLEESAAAERMNQPADLSRYASQPRGEIFNERMREFWNLWSRREELARTASPEVKELLEREHGLNMFFIQHLLGFVVVFDDSLPENDPNNFYMEREWRKLGNLRFTPDDVAHIYVPPDHVDRVTVDCPKYRDKLRQLERAL